MRLPTFAPAYCAMYPELAELCREHGYALAIHGSMQRDFDLICVPWVECPSEPSRVLRDIEKRFAIRRVGEPEVKLHGRIAYTLSITFGDCACDLSFMPIQKDDK